MRRLPQLRVGYAEASGQGSPNERSLCGLPPRRAKQKQYPTRVRSGESGFVTHRDGQAFQIDHGFSRRVRPGAGVVVAGGSAAVSVLVVVLPLHGRDRLAIDHVILGE